MTKKNLLAAALLTSSSLSAMAGGLLTNTNQNAAFVRQMAQAGIIDITGLYLNPAGTAFLSNGWHLSLNSQSAWQQRNIETTFPLFALNENNHNTMHRFNGEAKAPVIPSFQLSYNKDKWSVNASFGLIGGGGKCEFDQGLGSFEALYAGTIAAQKSAIEMGVNNALPTLAAQGMIAQGVNETTAAQLAGMGTYSSALGGYSMDAFMKGRSYYFGLQLGATYKFNDNLAGFIGLRGTYATCNYNGYVQDAKAIVSYDMNTPAIPGAFPGLATSGKTEVDLESDLALNCDQTGFGLSPIIGLDYKLNEKWNFAAKYEAPTKMNLKNKSEMNEFANQQVETGNEVLGKFADGKKVREDIPGILTLGVQYSPMQSLRLAAGFGEYFDKSAKKYGNKQKLIDHNTWDLNAGVEFDACKLVTVSASWQITHYGVSDAYMDDLSFNLTNNMVGFGVRLNATKRCSIDLGYMHTFYNDRTVRTETAAGVKLDAYERKNDVCGVGVNLKF